VRLAPRSRPTASLGLAGTPVLAWALACAVASPAAAADLKGVALYRGAVQHRPPVETIKDRAVCGAVVEDESLLVTGGRLANVVVMVRGAPRGPPATLALDQRGCRYRPRVQAAPVGSTLEVTNGDPILHSVHGWAGHVTRFDIVTPEPGVRIPTRLDRAGLIQVRCDVHSWMLAFVMVTEGPAAVSGLDGEFTIRDLPPGTYSVTAWHERLGEKVTQVTVPAEGEARLELTFDG
jgi:hypothetical protein